jgi:hypothetical protein
MGLSATSDDWCRKSDFVIEGNENTRKIVDDILCWGATMQELMTKLDTILLRCKAIGITLSINKKVPLPCLRPSFEGPMNWKTCGVTNVF